MPRKAQSDSEQEARVPKPKEQFRLVIGVYDNGYIDYDLCEFYTNEETGKRKRLMHDSPSKFKKAINDSLAEDQNKLACWILDGLGINVNEFAREVTDVVSYRQTDDPDAEDIELEDA